MPARDILRHRWFSLCLSGLLALAQTGAIMHGAEHAGTAPDLACPLCVAGSHLTGPISQAAMLSLNIAPQPAPELHSPASHRATPHAYRQRAPPTSPLC